MASRTKSDLGSRVIYRLGWVRIVWKILDEFSLFFFSSVSEGEKWGKECVTFRDKKANLLWNLIKKKKKKKSIME